MANKIDTLKSDIAEMEEVFNDSSTPADVKKALEPAIKKAKEELAEIEKKSEDKKPSATPKKSKGYKLGDMYSSDFDYEGMLEMALTTNKSWSKKDLRKLFDSFEDVNYHTPSQPLWDAINNSKNDKEVEENLKKFHKLVKEELGEVEEVVVKKEESKKKKESTSALQKCKDLLAKYEEKKKTDAKRLKKRAEQGKPIELTPAETVKKSAQKVEAKVIDIVEKTGGLKAAEINQLSKGIIETIKNTLEGITDTTKKHKFLKEIGKEIHDLEKHLPKAAANGMYMEDGGRIADSNKEMILSNIHSIKHHADEISEILKQSVQVEAWVNAKAERAATDLSDITHYLDGELHKFEDGGEINELIGQIYRPFNSHNEEYYVTILYADFDRVEYSDEKGSIHSAKAKDFFDSYINVSGYHKKGGLLNHYNTGRSWHLDRAKHNNSESWENRTFEDGGRIEGMVEHWNRCGWAGSHIYNNDSEFFEKIGKTSMEVPTTSFTGNDIKYYDEDRVDVVNGGFKQKFESGGTTDCGCEKHKFEDGGDVKKNMFSSGGMVARNILEQLGGAGKLKAMVGAYNFIDTGRGLSFRIKNPKANYIKITLNSMDLYDLEIGKIRGMDYKIVAEQNNLYYDQLKPIIEKVTGMYLTLAEGGEVYAKGGEIEGLNIVNLYSKDNNHKLRVFVTDEQLDVLEQVAKDTDKLIIDLDGIISAKPDATRLYIFLDNVLGSEVAKKYVQKLEMVEPYNAYAKGGKIGEGEIQVDYRVKDPIQYSNSMLYYTFDLDGRFIKSAGDFGKPIEQIKITESEFKKRFKGYIQDKYYSVKFRNGQVVPFIETLKEAKEIASAYSKHNLEQGGEVYAKGGGVSRSQKQYNKEVDAYKYFIVDLKNKKAISGWEHRSDANDALSDYDGDRNYKVVAEVTLRSLGIENPKEKFKKFEKGGIVYKNDIDGLKKGDVIKISFNSPIKSDNIKELKVSSRNMVSGGKTDKISFINLENPKGVKYFAYKRQGSEKWFWGMGDLAISNVKLLDENETFAKGGYISSEEYRDKLEAMTDNELLAAYCDEYGFDIEEDDHKERIEEERDMVIDDMVERYQRYMKSTGRMAKGGKIKKGDIGKITGMQYGFTLKEYDEKSSRFFVSPKEYWQSEEGTKYKDYFGRTRIVGEIDKDNIMSRYAYHIMMGIDLGSKKIPASAKKYAELMYVLTPNGIETNFDKIEIAKKQQEKFEDGGEVYAKGGKVSFKDKVKAISSRLEGTKVKPKYQKQYGKTYNKAESVEAATKIAGKQVAKSRMDKK